MLATKAALCAICPSEGSSLGLSTVCFHGLPSATDKAVSQSTQEAQPTFLSMLVPFSMTTAKVSGL